MQRINTKGKYIWCSLKYINHHKGLILLCVASHLPPIAVFGQSCSVGTFLPKETLVPEQPSSSLPPLPRVINILVSGNITDDFGRWHYKCMSFVVIVSYHTTKLLGVYWFLSVCWSVRPSRVLCPLCIAYSSGWIHFIFIHLILIRCINMKWIQTEL